MSLRRCAAGSLVVAALIAALAGCAHQSAPGAAVAAMTAVPAAAAEPEPAPANPPAAKPVVPPRTAAMPSTVAMPPTATRSGLPPGVPEPPASTGQLITVVASTPTATTATLQAWERQPAGGWRATVGPLRAKVGTDGVGRASETSRRTPAGSYGLDQAFGRQPDPGTKLPYRQVGNDDWWVSDAHSPAYNTHQHCPIGTCRFNESAGENLGQAGASYDYAVVIGYNTARPVAGAGSAFFLHVDAGAASAGCVEVPRATVLSLLRWLDPARHPRISITVG